MPINFDYGPEDTYVFDRLPAAAPRRRRRLRLPRLPRRRHGRHQRTGAHR